MEYEMKTMSEEEKTVMRKIMKGVVPEMVKNQAQMQLHLPTIKN